MDWLNRLNRLLSRNTQGPANAVEHTYLNAKFNAGYHVRHVKTGRVYQIITSMAIIEATMERAYIYSSVEDHTMWVRPRAEMEDGRFVPADSP